MILQRIFLWIFKSSCLKKIRQETRDITLQALKDKKKRKAIKKALKGNMRGGLLGFSSQLLLSYMKFVILLMFFCIWIDTIFL
ncbi:unnamed protein product [Cuscuta campestris]|uniref:Uncharacterized protein n=1 Tax=Cuscuta campestris TaxID=132261 RepID=A0A484L2Y9_9ASTE|nr:unnamed protein product [Cuscuta campestris]